MNATGFALLLAVLVCVAVAAAAGLMIRRGRPCLVVPLLAVGSLVSAAAVGVMLSLLAVAVVGRISVVADFGGWSVDALAVTVPVPAELGISAAVLVAYLIGRTLRRAAAILFLLVRSDRLSRRIRGGGGPIVIADDNYADAFTIAGMKGCVVISRGLFDTLGPAERLMLTGHEMSHLRHRHHLYVHAADLAAAANPLLGRVADVVRLGVERWADEDAATIAGDRTCAAEALARTALARSALRRAAAPLDRSTTLPVLEAVASHITERANALMSPAPRGRAAVAWLTVLLVLAFAATVGSTVQMKGGFEHAEMAWLTLQR